MKKLAIIVLGVLFSITTFAQSPEGFKYQAVVRNTSGTIVPNQAIGMQVRLRQGTSTGTIVYEESFTPTSNTYGLVNMTIGTGTVSLGTFANIDWSAGPYFVEIGMDITGGTSYTVMGVSQLMSVPYALYAKTAANTGVTYTAGTGISLTGNIIDNTAPDQTVTILGTGSATVTGTYPNFTVNATDNVNDADADPTNELQDISLVGDSLKLTQGSTINLSNITNVNSWSTTGNAGTNSTTNFIGTTDGQPLMFKVGAHAGMISATKTSCSFGYKSSDSLTTGIRNSSFGYRSLLANTAGNLNSAFGYSTLYYNKGDWNTAVGGSALEKNTTGKGNTAIGVVALFLNTTGSYNIANGMDALHSNISGSHNVAIGTSALYSNTTSSNLVAVGDSALYHNTSGNSNTAIGSKVLYSNTTGNYNTANGKNAMYSNTTGYDNTAIGLNALYSNTIGTWNTASGASALYSNTTGTRNTANGLSALYSNTTGQNNTATGYQSLYNNITGFYNTAHGASALYSNTTGSYNTANGFNALLGNTTGIANTANGESALFLNLTGNYNTANGSGALYNNTIGNNNVAIGFQASYMNQTGNNNVAIGKEALINNSSASNNTAIGYQAAYLNTIGDRNVTLGNWAMYSNTTGIQNTALGYYAGNTGNFSNRVAIGYNVQNTASNQVRIGNSVVNSIGGYTSWSNVSDARFKKDINENVVGLDFILKLRPVTYHLNMDAIAEKLNTPDSLRNKKVEQAKGAMLQTGFIAQEVEKTAQTLGYDFSGVDAPKNANDYYGLRYAEFVVPLVKATQEQQTIIENQQKEIDELKALVKQLLEK